MVKTCSIFVLCLVLTAQVTKGDENTTSGMAATAYDSETLTGGAMKCFKCAETEDACKAKQAETATTAECPSGKCFVEQVETDKIKRDCAAEDDAPTSTKIFCSSDKCNDDTFEVMAEKYETTTAPSKKSTDKIFGANKNGDGGSGTAFGYSIKILPTVLSLVAPMMVLKM